MHFFVFIYFFLGYVIQEKTESKRQIGLFGRNFDRARRFALVWIQGESD